MKLGSSYFIRIIIVLSIIGVIAIIARPTAAPSTKDCLPVVMILSDADSGLYKASSADCDPMYTMLKCSLESELTIIISTPVLYWLTKRTAEGRNSMFDWTRAVKERYSVSITKGNKLALLIPHKYTDKLDFLGFNKDYLNPVAYPELKKIFAHQKFESLEIDPQELDQLLRKHTFTNPACPKYFYITGHGLDAITEPHFLRADPVIAQMPIYNMVNTLEILNDTNTRLVYLLSCYTAGSNLVQFQNLLSGSATDDRCQPIQSLNYPVLIQCTMDTASTRITGKYFSLAGLFNAMMKWRNKETVDLGQLAHDIGQLYAKAPADERFPNFPICRLPGSGSHFQALALPQTTVIERPVTSATTYEIPQSVEMIQFYPRNAQKLTIAISSNKLPSMMSRLPGPAHHFIGELNIQPKSNLNNIIRNIFFSGLEADGQMYYGIADKAWFIQKVVANNKTSAQGLVVYKGCLKRGKTEMTVVYKGNDGNYYRLQSPLHLYFGMPHPERIDEKEYVKTISRIYWQTIPSQDALNETGDGSETIRNHEYLFDNFCGSLSIKATLATKKELIEQDFKDLENKKLTTENYINYAAYMHDTELTASIVDAALAGKIFSPYDCLTLLVYLIADGHQEIALDQIHKIARQKNTKAMDIVIDVLLNLVESERYKLIENTKGDLLQCLATNTADQQVTPKKIEVQLIKCTQELINNDHDQLATEMIYEIQQTPTAAMHALGSALESTTKKS